MNAKTANARQLDIIGNGDRLSAQEVLTATLKRWRQRLTYCSIFAAVPAILASNIPMARSHEPKKPEAKAVEPTPERLRSLNNRVSNRALLKRQSEFRLPHQKGNFAMLAAVAGNDDCPGRAIPGGNYTAAAPFIDSGDTTGANDTVTEVPSFYYYYFNYSAHGPDHVYSFTLTGRGPNPKIEVSTTSGTYKPMIYIGHGGYDGACPAGTGNIGNWFLASDSRWTSANTAILPTWAFDHYLPLNVPLYLFIDSAKNDAFGAGPYTIKMQDVTIAPAVTCSNPNSIDCAEFFVRQHYRDFLNREPDVPGGNFWTDEITKCNNAANRLPGESEALCIDRKRDNTSAAFFLSPEFQYTGSFAVRVNWGSLGQDRASNRTCIVGQHSALPAVCRPLYSQYVADMAKLTQGIVVNNQLDAAKINANKQAYVAEFVARPEFLAAYPITMTAAEYVDKLSQTTGVTLLSQERQDLINEVNTPGGRASVLFKMVDGAQVISESVVNFQTRYGKAYYDQTFNAVFVFMEYLGYLQRNPDQEGFDFWLGKLNRYGNWKDAEMVRSFIVSPEYRSRFNP